MGLPLGETIKILVNALLVSLLVASLTSCGQDMSVFKIDTIYSVVTTDTKADTCLAYNLGNGSHIGRVDGQVVAVGWDAQFIIIKQHHKGNPKDVKFFILDKSKDSMTAEPGDSVLGPLDSTSFVAERVRLRVPALLDFTKHF